MNYSRRNFWRRLKRMIRPIWQWLIGRRCEICRRRYRVGNKQIAPYDPCCSQVCFRKWIPF